MTVLENLKIGAYLRRDKAEIQKDLQLVYDLFPRLKERSWQAPSPAPAQSAAEQ